jgi:hypothetical protein
MSSPPLPRAAWASLVALWLALTVAYVGHPEGRFTAGGRAHGDGTYHYAYLRSLVVGHDFDFRDDYAALGDPHAHPRRGRLPENRFTVGAALLWLPTFAVGQAATATTNALGWTAEPLDGRGPQVQRITLYASVLHALAAALAVMLIARRAVADWAACAAGIAVVVATPLWWYAVYQPSFSHAASAAAVATFVLVWLEGRADRDARGHLRLGALLGLVALVRPQDAVFGLLPAFDLARAGWRGRGSRDMSLRTAGHAAALAGAAALVFAPQMIAWWQIYGSPLTVPQGPEFMLWGASKPLFSLFSGRGGLIAWSPATGLGLLGAGLLALRRGPLRAAAGLLLAAFAVEAYVAGAARDWWAGWSFGGRRYLGCTALFGLGLAGLLDAAHAWLLRHARAALAAGLLAGLAGLVVCNLSLTHDFLYGELDRGRPMSLRPASERLAQRVVAAVYDSVGHPGSAPASWWFAWRGGVPPDRYDPVSGFELVDTIENADGNDRIWLDDPRWGLAGFAPRSLHLGQRASVVAGTAARFVLPMRRGERLQARLRLAAVAAPARVEISIAGVPVFAAEVERIWRDHRFEIPAAALGPGFNFAEVRQTGAGVPAVAWGELQLWRGDADPAPGARDRDARP